MAWANNVVLVLAAVGFIALFVLIFLYTFTSVFDHIKQRTDPFVCSELTPQYCEPRVFTEMCAFNWTPECERACNALVDPCQVAVCQKTAAGKRCSPCALGWMSAECQEPVTYERFCTTETFMNGEREEYENPDCMRNCDARATNCAHPFCQALNAEDATVCNPCTNSGEGLSGCKNADLRQQLAYCESVGEARCIEQCTRNPGHCENVTVCQHLGQRHPGVCDVCRHGLTACAAATIEVQQAYCDQVSEATCRAQCAGDMNGCYDVAWCREQDNLCNKCAANNYTTPECQESPTDQREFCAAEPATCHALCTQENQEYCAYPMCDDYQRGDNCQPCNPVATRFFSEPCNRNLEAAESSCADAGAGVCNILCGETDTNIIQICQSAYCRKHHSPPASTCNCTSGLDEPMCDAPPFIANHLSEARQVCAVHPDSAYCGLLCTSTSDSACRLVPGAEFYIGSRLRPGMVLELIPDGTYTFRTDWVREQDAGQNSLFLVSTASTIVFRGGVVDFAQEGTEALVTLSGSGGATASSSGLRNEYTLRASGGFYASATTEEAAYGLLASNKLVDASSLIMLPCRSVSSCGISDFATSVFRLWTRDGRLISPNQTYCANIEPVFQFLSGDTSADLYVGNFSADEQAAWYLDWGEADGTYALVNHRFWSHQLRVDDEGAYLQPTYQRGSAIPRRLLIEPDGAEYTIADVTDTDHFYMGEENGVLTSVVGREAALRVSIVREPGLRREAYRKPRYSPSPFDLGESASTSFVRMSTGQAIQITSANVNVVDKDPLTTSDCAPIRCNFGANITAGNVRVASRVNGLSLCTATFGLDLGTGEMRGINCRQGKIGPDSTVDKRAQRIVDATDIFQRELSNYLTFHRDGSFSIMGTPEANNPAVLYGEQCVTDVPHYYIVKHPDKPSRLQWKTTAANLARFVIQVP